MVRFWLLLLFSVWMLGVNAQSFPVDDTVTEYRMKGTFYHNRFEGRKTASGDIFDQNLFTAAHKKIKLGTHVLVINQNTGKQIIVKINDRCPRRGIIDLSRRAAHAIGIKGSQPVTVRILPEGYEERCLAQDTKFDSVESRLNHGTPSETKQEPRIAKKSKSEELYNLMVGTAQNHGEAFELTQRLPDYYRNMTIIDSPDDSLLTIIVNVRLPQKRAKELARAMKYDFPDCQIVPVE